MASPAEVARLVERLKAAFPRSRIPPDTVSVYTEALAKFELERVTSAIAACTEHCKFFPSVAEIIKALPPLRGYVPDRERAVPWEDTPSAALELGRQVCTLDLADGSRMDVREEDLRGPRGERGFPNAVFFEAKDAMGRALESRLAEHAARRAERGETAAPRARPTSKPSAKRLIDERSPWQDD